MKEITDKFLSEIRAKDAAACLKAFEAYDNDIQDIYKTNPDEAWPYYFQALKATLRKCKKDKPNYKSLSSRWNGRLLREYCDLLKSIQTRMDISNSMDASKEEKHAAYGQLFNKLTDMPPIQQIYGWELFVSYIEPCFFDECKI